MYYLWHSAEILKIKVYELLPLQKLVVKFLILIALYVITLLLLANSPTIIKLIIGGTFTALLILTGMWSYFKTFFKKNNGQIS